MVKIPGIDDLKKMGSNLIDSAKSVKFGEMVEKVKSGIESVSTRKSPAETVTDETLKNSFQAIFTTINELAQVQTAQINTIKKLEKQLEDLAKIVEAYQNPPTPTEESKTHE
ncbi:MAG TPA: hypothetical protein VHA13_03230 [Gammaproteobacteria bacterium]|nr:hypothetical protein [Gammaproteobacteria bacterium]